MPSFHDLQVDDKLPELWDGDEDEEADGWDYGIK